MSKKKRVFNTMDSYSRRNLIQNSIKIIRISKADKYGEKNLHKMYCNQFFSNDKIKTVFLSKINFTGGQ